jgi:hypothetical protein
VEYLVIGNGPSISCIDWSQAVDTTLCTIGINRSYMEYPDQDILFFQDPIIIQELLDAGYSNSDLKALKLHTTNYFNKRLLRDRIKGDATGKEFDSIASLVRDGTINIVRQFAFYTYAPFTIPNAISYFSHLDNRKIKKGRTKKYTNANKLTFYLCGCDLKFDSQKNHFWQNKYESLSRLSGAGGSSSKQLRKQYQAFQRLNLRTKFLNIEIISTTPESKLNTLFKYESIQSVLARHRKRTKDDR